MRQWGMRGWSLVGLLLIVSPVWAQVTSTPAIDTVMDEGVSLGKQRKLNFTGSGISCTTNTGLRRYDCVVTAGGSSVGASGALQSSNGAGGLADSGVTASGGNLTANSLAIVGGGLGSNTFLAGTPPAAPSNANEVKYYFNVSTLRLESIANGGTAKDYATTADTQTFTNKSLDCEGTGNVCTIQRRVSLRAARCNGTTPNLGDFELPSTGAATLVCSNQTNTTQGVLRFADATTQTAQYHWKLTSELTGAIDAKIDWSSAATTGNVVFTIRTSCSGAGETTDPGWGATSTALDATQGTTNRHNDIIKTGISIATCAAGKWMHVELGRDGANGSDTMTDVADVYGLELLLREAK